MQAIFTKFRGATNTRGARVEAKSSRGKKCSIGYAHELNEVQNHAAVAMHLAGMQGWDGEWAMGEGLEGAGGYVFVRIGEATVYGPNVIEK